jgi:hypothetical protein
VNNTGPYIKSISTCHAGRFSQACQTAFTPAAFAADVYTTMAILSASYCYLLMASVALQGLTQAFQKPSILRSVVDIPLLCTVFGVTERKSGPSTCMWGDGSRKCGRSRKMDCGDCLPPTRCYPLGPGADCKAGFPNCLGKCKGPFKDPPDPVSTVGVMNCLYPDGQRACGTTLVYTCGPCPSAQKCNGWRVGNADCSDPFTQSCLGKCSSIASESLEP